MENIEVLFTARSKVEVLPCEMPVPGPGECLAKTTVSQISIGTELTYLEGNVEAGMNWEKDIIFPRKPGYNNVAEIVAVGEGVSAELIGKHVHSGQKHVKYFTFKADDPAYSVVPEGVEDKEAVFCTMGTITMASIRMAQIRPGDMVVVYGAGIIGQMVARLALICGASKVLVCDMSDLRLEKLPKLPGMIAVNSGKCDIKEAVREVNNGRLADVVFETTSVGALAQQEIECLESFGKLVITSSPKARSTVDLEYCNRKCITILGVHNVVYHRTGGHNANRWTVPEDNKLMLELLRQKRLTTAEMITHETNYKDAVSMYEMLMADRTQALGVNLIWED